MYFNLWDLIKYQEESRKNLDKAIYLSLLIFCINALIQKPESPLSTPLKQQNFQSPKRFKCSECIIHASVIWLLEIYW